MAELPRKSGKSIDREPTAVPALFEQATNALKRNVSQITTAVATGILAVSQLACTAKVEEADQMQVSAESVEAEIKGEFKPSLGIGENGIENWAAQGKYPKNFRLEAFSSDANQSEIPEIEDCTLFSDEIVQVDENGNYQVGSQTPENTIWIRFRATKEDGQPITIDEEDAGPDGMIGSDNQGIPH